MDAAALFTNTNIPTRVVAKDSMKLSDHSFGRQKLLLWVGGVGDEQTVTASKEGCEHPVRRAGQDVERCGLHSHLFSLQRRIFAEIQVSPVNS